MSRYIKLLKLEDELRETGTQETLEILGAQDTQGTQRTQERQG